MRSTIMADAVRAAYHAGQEDETMEPLVLQDSTGVPLGRIQDGDYVIFYDIRGEREVELTEAFVAREFPHFPRLPMRVHFATMIEYAPHLDVRVAFPPLGAVPDTLGQVVSQAGLRQARIVESEKAVHVGFFLNGKRHEPFPGEERIVVPSPHGTAFAEMPPEMSASAVADAAIDALHDPAYDMVVVNLCNTDVIGHIENPDAIRTAVQTVDAQAGRILGAARAAGVSALVTADHGTVERWYYPDGTIDTGHTDNPVPCVLVMPGAHELKLRSGGALSDVAPTLLHLLNLPQPAAMTGRSLIEGALPPHRRRVLLLILDGWGLGDGGPGDLIAAAHTPVLDRLQTEHPAARLEAAGRAVGMPAGTVGNSEAGHLHMGAGRVVLADRVRIEDSIADGSFFENPAFLWAMHGAIADGARLHLLGIISFYSSHGSVEHLLHLLEMARRVGVPQVYIHGMLGRRGERPESGALYVEQVERQTEALGLGQFVSVIGRFWSLDREENWDRIEKTYRLLVQGEGQPVPAESE